MSRTTAYTALSSAQYDDVVPIVDVHDTSMAATGTTKKITVRNLRGLSLIYLNDYGADPTGATLSDSAWTAAYAAATAQIAAWSGDTGLTAGAVIVLGTGIYKFSFATVAITDMRIGLVGQGAALTRITSTSVTSGALVRVSYSGTEPAGSPSAPVGGFTVWGWDAFGSNQVGFHADGGRTHCRVADIYAQGFVSTGGIAFKFTPLGGAGWEGASFLGLDAQNSNIAFYFDGANGGSNNGTMDYTSWNIHSVAANTVLQAVNGVHFYGASMTLHGNIGGGAGTSGANTFGVIGASSSDTARFQNCQLFLQHEVDAGSSSVTDFTITGTSSAGIIDCYGLIGFVNAGGTMLAGSLGGSSVFKFQGLVEVCPLATAMAGSKYQLGGQYTAVDSTGTTANVTGNIKVTGYVTASNLPIVPSGDTSGATDTAAINAIAQAGKIALLTAGTYYVTHLLPDSLGGIVGVGPATVLQAVSGTTGYAIALKTPASTYQVTLQNFAIKPNTGSLGGIQIDNTGFTSGGGENDPLHVLDGIYVQSAGGDAYHFDNNARSMRVTRCMAYSSGAAGFYVGTGCTDTTFVSCTSGASTGHGWDVRGVDNYFASCKGFYAGWNGSVFDTSHNAWDIQGSWNSFVGCMAQNGALHGFNLYNSCQHNALVGCVADANNSGGTTGVGINTNGITSCTIVGCTGNNHGGSGQIYGLQVAGTQTGTVFVMNSVNGSTAQFNYVSGSGYTLMSQAVMDFGGSGYFKIPAQVLSNDGAQALTSSGTIKTATDGNFGAIPVTETGNVTGMILEAASNAWTKVTVVNQSAFTITFAASGTSHVADGTSDVIPALCARSYIYDGSLWYRDA